MRIICGKLVILLICKIWRDAVKAFISSLWTWDTWTSSWGWMYWRSSTSKMSFSHWYLQGLQWLTQKCRFGPWILESTPWTCQPWMITHIPLTSNPSPPLTSRAFPPHIMKIFLLPELTSQAWIINMISSSRIAKVSFAFLEAFPSCPCSLHSLEHVLAANGFRVQQRCCQQRCFCRADRKERILIADLQPARAAAGV